MKYDGFPSTFDDDDVNNSIKHFRYITRVEPIDDIHELMNAIEDRYNILFNLEDEG